jgi:hypothetical protein
MLSTFELRSQFDRLLSSLPENIRRDLSVTYFHCSTLHGITDVVIHRNGQCMALGRFRPVSEEPPSEFAARFQMAMGYPEDTWYLFDFDGERIVVNDLSLEEPQDDFYTYLEQGVGRLTTLPALWRKEQKTLQEMKMFLESMRHLIEEETFLNPVN